MQFIEYKKQQALRHIAKKLRIEQTKYEKKLWAKLRAKQLFNIRFHRQYVLLNC